MHHSLGSSMSYTCSSFHWAKSQYLVKVWYGDMHSVLGSSVRTLCAWDPSCKSHHNIFEKCNGTSCKRKHVTVYVNIQIKYSIVERYSLHANSHPIRPAVCPAVRSLPLKIFVMPTTTSFSWRVQYEIIPILDQCWRSSQLRCRKWTNPRIFQK